MDLHGRNGDVDLVRDDLVRVTFRETAQDTFFLGGQACAFGGGSPDPHGGRALLPIADQRQDARKQEGLSESHQLERFEEDVARDPPGKARMGPRTKQKKQIADLIRIRKNRDTRRRMPVPEDARFAPPRG